jgi:hypothetical protein
LKHSAGITVIPFSIVADFNAEHFEKTRVLEKTTSFFKVMFSKLVV